MGNEWTLVYVVFTLSAIAIGATFIPIIISWLKSKLDSGSSRDVP